jgi:hypothetical protein
MRILLIVAFLVFPSIGFSGMGDVYFCESTKLIRLENGEVTEYKNEKFKFKRTSNGLIFGSEDGYLKDVKLKVNVHDVGSDLFTYRSDDTDMIFSHEKGTFTMSHVLYLKVISMIGKCSVF